MGGLRQQLEADRRDLQRELDLLSQQQEELVFGDSQRKIKPAREGVALCAQRERLDLLREALHAETERVQRQGSVR